MTAESDEIQQNGEKTLSKKQRKAIPVVLAASSVSAGCERAGIDRSTWYQWLAEPAFKAELEHQRDALAAEAFSCLSHGLQDAVETLTGLLGDSDKRLRRLAAKDVVSLFIQCKQTADLESRIEAIEQNMGE